MIPRSSVRRAPAGNGHHTVWTGCRAPGTRITGAPPSRAAVRSASTVADMATRARSSRRLARTSMSSARVRSASRWRSCTSSSTTAPTPTSSGSCWIRRSSSPVVTISTRVRRLRASVSAYGVSDRLSHRFAQQVRQPTCSSAGCDAAGLRHDHPTVNDLGDRGRDQGRLAGARRCVDHRDSASAKRLDESGQASCDREVRRRGEQVAQRVGHSCSVPDALSAGEAAGHPPADLTSEKA